MNKLDKKFDCTELRKKILRMAYVGNSVHIGCAFSIVEILAVIYRNHIQYPKNDPNALERDYFILSKGHGVMAQYACIHEMGWISNEQLENYFSEGSELKGLSDSRISGLEVTSGSLGHGFSVGVGLAMGAKLSNLDQKTYVLVGDGEINEGAIWEGALFASHNNLKNFMVIVDANGYQAMGPTNEVIDLGSIQLKFESFGFEVMEVDGHNELAIDDAINCLLNSKSTSPKAIIAKTTKGKGVSFMENNNMWHYSRLNEETYHKALVEVSENL